jgi:hypothetical protein
MEPALARLSKNAVTLSEVEGNPQLLFVTSGLAITRQQPAYRAIRNITQLSTMADPQKSVKQ